MKTYLRLLNYARPLGWLLPQYIIYTLLHVVFSIANFAVMIPLLRLLFNFEKKTYVHPGAFDWTPEYLLNLFNYHFSTVLLEKGHISALFMVCATLVIASVFSNLFKYIASVMLSKIRVNVVTNLRNDYFEKVLNLDLGFFTNNRRGDLISRGMSDILEVENAVVDTFAVIIKDPIMIIALFTVLFKTSPTLTLYSIIILPISGLIISLIVKRLKRVALKMQHTFGEIGNTLDESIGGIRIVKAFSAENYVKERFKNRVQEYGKHNIRIAKLYNLGSPLSEAMGISTLSLLLLIGGQLVFKNESGLSGAEFIGFLIFFSQLLSPFKSFAGAFSSINRGIASGERVFDIMDSKTEIVSEENKPISQLEKSIIFDNVSFAYEEKEVLKNINFELSKGKIIALVGSSGGGKSTIADLIPRFYDPKSGKITVDGHGLKTYNISQLRNMMGVVSQESILFNDSVFNNIAFGMPNATLEKVIAAAKVANAHGFIEKLENGYQTEIGERGTKLSGGQRQRISIARAVLKNPPILILDEATSALDSESEKLVQNAISNLMQNRTTLVIAHRLSTIQHADEILVIKEGGIAERGTHESLINEQGIYYKLTNMQSF